MILRTSLTVVGERVREREGTSASTRVFRSKLLREAQIGEVRGSSTWGV